MAIEHDIFRVNNACPKRQNFVTSRKYMTDIIYFKKEGIFFFLSWELFELFRLFRCFNIFCCNPFRFQVGKFLIKTQLQTHCVFTTLV